MRRTIALLLMMILLIPGSVGMATAASTVEYTFSTTIPGYAEGTISITAPSDGDYRLCWGDENGALDGYYPLCELTLEEGVRTDYTVAPHVAIPAGADRLLLQQDSVIADYRLPTERRLTGEVQYRFAALSDIHIDEQDAGASTYYTNASDHFALSLQRSAEHDVDFVVTAGDMITNASGATLEWLEYQRIIAASDYAGAIYEAIGNHEMRFSKYTSCDPVCGIEEFIVNTGLSGDAETVAAGKPYYELTEPVSGDHFLFMALENGYDPALVDNFSTEQLDWVEGLLEQYEGDGRRVFLIQHSPIRGYGAGDDPDDPAYGGSMITGDAFPCNTRFRELLERYRDVIWLSGHTHVDFQDDVNYSDMDGTSCHMLHIPSVAGTTRLSYDSEGERTLDRTFYDDATQGYMVAAYADAVVFEATNLYHDKVYPAYSYIFGEPSQEDPPVLLGDANGDGIVDIMDATTIQRHLAHLTTLPEIRQKAGMVNGDDELTISDATTIQRYLAHFISRFPAEIASTSASSTDETAKDILDAYSQYASYPAYTALKSAYLSGGDTAAANDAFGALRESIAMNTVYFSDVTGMGNLHAYVWNSRTGDYLEAWPGQQATWVYRNSLSQNVYAVTVDAKKYDRIVFNDGTDNHKTADIPLGKKSGMVYYPVSTTSPFLVSSSIWNRMWFDDPDDTIDVYFTNTKGWSNVYLYYWNSTGNNGWPGTKMTFVRYSSSSKGIYRATIPADSQAVFSDGTNQTVDVPTLEDGFGYYPYEKNSSGKYTVIAYRYD